MTEHHLKSPPFPETDSKSHVYTLTIRPDATFRLLVDGDERSSGSLLEQLEPPINPPKARRLVCTHTPPPSAPHSSPPSALPHVRCRALHAPPLLGLPPPHPSSSPLRLLLLLLPPQTPQDIPDPSDVKPADWVDEAEIADPSDSQPSDWDEREMVEDADATKPAGWLDDEPEFTTDPGAARGARRGAAWGAGRSRGAVGGARVCSRGTRLTPRLRPRPLAPPAQTP